MLLGLATSAAADAHPLGNFTRNLYTGLTVSPDRVSIDRVVDLAEIPAFQERQRMDADGDGVVDDAEAAGYRRQACTAQAADLSVSTAGRRLPLTVDSATLTFPGGAGGLATLRLECRLSTPSAGATQLDVDDHAFTGRLGWHEITAVGDGVAFVGSDVPSTSLSRRLTTYPADLLQSPVDRRTARLHWRSAGAAAAADGSAVVGLDPVTAAAPRGVDSATRAFTDLIGRQRLTVTFTLIALLLAMALGGLHALSPGHGKTLMAGYLLGVGGRVRDAVTIGLAVTVTHTAGVLALGLLLAASAQFAPERAYPWLGLVSGLLAVGIGATLLRTALRRLRTASAVGRRQAGKPARRHPEPASLVTTAAGSAIREGPGTRPQRPDGALDEDARHDHPPAHEVDSDTNGEHVHDHGPHGHTHAVPARRVGLLGLLWLGLAGGMVPSPSAIVVLLAGFAQHRAWFGLALVAAYGVGMALTLVCTGLVLVRAGALLSRMSSRRGHGRLASLAARLPVAAACAVLLTGGYLVVNAATGI
jgi:ABC-type nickel/cobalt efflux system permease component RcnA